MEKTIASLAGFVVTMAFATETLAQGLPSTVDSGIGPLQVEIFAEGLSNPWGAAFLPDGSLLVTERTGSLRRIGMDGAISDPVEGTPEVFAEGQGGLLDVALDPEFSSNRVIYLSFAEARSDGAATSVGRGRLNGEVTALEEFEIIFRQQPAVPGGNHFGSRLAFSPEGHLFVTLGERFDYMQQAQDPTNHLGTVVRINPDGSVPQDNPFIDGEGADEVWSYGHRNVQGAAIHPETGALWTAEFGPSGGDEVNIPQAGENYGWPVVSHGRHYSGQQIPDPSSQPEFADAIYFWDPAISPSGIAFVTSDLFPQWQGDLLLGGLSSQAIVRLDLEGNEAVGDERIEMGVRIRDVLFGPEGQLYALVDGPDSPIIRLTPADN